MIEMILIFIAVYVALIWCKLFDINENMKKDN